VSPSIVNDYRSITLLNCCLKIITKLLANRLQKVILKIIHRKQYCFIHGRSIHDCLAWRFRYIHQCQASKQKIVLLKLDFAKAFYTIEREPMINIMKHMRFNDKWLSWIKSIFSSGRSSILLNGLPGRQFQCRHGVRQGDPLSPIIFVFAANLLQSAINDAYRRGLIHLPFPCNGQMDYPIVQYADDTLLLMPACPRQATIIKSILTDYAQSISPKINFQKSTLIPINLVAELPTSRLFFGCSIGSMPFTYLGLPLGTSHPIIQDFMPLVSSVEWNISSTLSLMSYAGKLTLLNTTVTSLLIYAMCTVKFPPKLLEMLDKIRRRCLWIKKTYQGDKCNSLAAWEMVCKPKNKGGLGVINLMIQNEALLMKFLHKFYNKMDIPSVTYLRH